MRERCVPADLGMPQDPPGGGGGRDEGNGGYMAPHVNGIVFILIIQKQLSVLWSAALILLQIWIFGCRCGSKMIHSSKQFKILNGGYFVSGSICSIFGVLTLHHQFLNSNTSSLFGSPTQKSNLSPVGFGSVFLAHEI